jgi:aspartate aminotransferase
MKLSERATQVPGSPTLAVTAKVAQLRSQGINVIGFGAGEPDFETPAHIRDAAKRGLDEGWTRYTPAGGLPAVKQAIIDHMAKHFQLHAEPSEVMVSCGGKHALYNAMMCLCNPGDEVLLPAPYWVTYPVQIQLAGGKTVVVPTTAEEGFRVQVSDLEAAWTPNTKGLILNSPSNPTGAGYTEDDLLAIARFAVQRDLWVVSDEIYARLTYDDYQSRFFATLTVDGHSMADRTLTVYGLSKTYAMTGWRIGIAIGNATLISAMTRLQGQVTSNPATVSQAGAIAALTESDAFLAQWLEAFDARRRYIVDRLNAIEGVHCNLPQGAFYAFPNFSGVLGRRLGERTLETDWDLTDYLLDDARVAIVPGTPFGAPGFARFSYASSMETIETGLDRITEALKKLS